MLTSATVSPCGQFRYDLSREWAVGGSVALFVMLNPSTADAMTDDPTIRKCISYAKAWGYGGIRVVNLCSYRATKPSDMYHWVRSSQTDEQRRADMLRLSLDCAVSDVKLIVCAWGKVMPGRLHAHAENCRQAMRSKRRLHYLKLNLDGSPAHPLYLKGNLVPQEWQQ